MTFPRDTAVQHRLGELLARNMAAANLLGRVERDGEVGRDHRAIMASRARYSGSA